MNDQEKNTKIEDPQKKINYLQSYWSKTKEFFVQLIDLEEGLDREGTIIAIKNNKRMQGANAWLLMCSIMVASLGLDLNSPAVIIGAMLISPLMSPILGVGLGIGINDRETLIISLRHFGIAIAIALITSVLYFWATPLGEITHEISSRTKPSLLDGLVAVFGGFAGIISASRKDASNAIPGVAIATALMPPLCVAGFGIANGRTDIFLNSFYLFFLNSFFIAMSTLVMVVFMRFPVKRYMKGKERRRNTIIMVIATGFLLLPSARILHQIWQENEREAKALAFIKEYMGPNEIYIDDWDLKDLDTAYQLRLKVYGTVINRKDQQFYEGGLKKFGLKNTTLEIIPTTEISLEKIKQLETQVQGVNVVANQINSIKKAILERDSIIENLMVNLDSIHTDSVPIIELDRTMKIFFPQLESFSFTKNPASASPEQIIPTAIIKWEKRKDRTSRIRDQKMLYEYITYKAKIDTLRILVE